MCNRTPRVTVPEPEAGRRDLSATTLRVGRIQRCGIGSSCDCAPEDKLAGIQRDLDRSAAGAGAVLPDGVRARMEQAYAFDFSSVRIHADPSAHQIASALHARALTAGTDIWFGSGAYRPDTSTGDRLIAHELAHVVQQSNGRPQAALDGGPTDPLEVEAEDAATATVRGSRMPALSPQRFAVARQDLDAGVPTDAAVPTDAGMNDPAWANQTNCVIRLGACPSTRPGGIPSTEEIARYNTECRPETSYAGPDVAPSDEECRNPPPAVPAPPQQPQPDPGKEPLAFARSLATRYPRWLDVLLDCPCTDKEARESSAWSGPGACQPPYHVGAATGYRSTRGYQSVPGTNHGQQCCYDPDGLLITEGAGAGTPDLVQAPSGFGAALGGILGSGPGPLAAWNHYDMDVVPFNKLGWEVYNQYWVPNNGKGCPPNRKP